MKHSKNVFFSAIIIGFLLLGFQSEAQVQKGDINGGVNGAITAVSSGGSTFTSTFISFSGQYFITDNISAGFGPSITFSGGSGTDNTSVGLNFFGNYNYLLPSGDLLPYAGANLFIRTSKSVSDATGDEFGNNTTNLGINGGAKYFFTERINFDVNLSYTFAVSASSSFNGTSQSVDADGGIFQFTFGLGIILGRRGN